MRVDDILASALLMRNHAVWVTSSIRTVFLPLHAFLCLGAGFTRCMDKWWYCRLVLFDRVAVNTNIFVTAFTSE